MSFARYAPLPQKLPDDELHMDENVAEPVSRHTSIFSTRACLVLLLLSVVLNIVQFVGSITHWSIVSKPPGLKPPAQNEWDHEPTPFANLEHNVSTPFASSSGFGTFGVHNQSAFDAIWESAEFMPNRGFVAVDVDWAADKGLPSTQPWPWDKQKGIYGVRAMHLLHCTKAFHRSFDELRDNKPLYWGWAHLEHCTHALREEIMCNANDNLVYTGRFHGQEDVEVPISGLNQNRMCKDWSQLVNWVTERSACYWNIEATGPGFRESERYKFCPDGKKYW